MPDTLNNITTKTGTTNINKYFIFFLIIKTANPMEWAIKSRASIIIPPVMSVPKSRLK
jgi:hypothetical protein